MATPIPSRLTFFGTVRPGNTIEARWIVGHPMETGFRVSDAGQRGSVRAPLLLLK